MWRMQRVYHEREQRDMDDPLVVRGLLQWLCFVTFFLARYVLDVLLTPDVVDDTVRSAWRGGRTALVKAWPLLRTCYAPLAPVLLMQVWKLATLDMLQWACGYACSFRLVMHLLMHDSLVVGSLTKGHVWPQIVPFVTFVRVSSGRARRVDAEWQIGPRYFLCRAVPWAVRICLLALLLRWSLPWRTHQRDISRHPHITDKVVDMDMDTEREDDHDDLVARISRCYDGDTCTASRVLWGEAELPPILGRDIGVRVRGIDAPEMKGRCALERCLAARAQQVLERFVTSRSAAGLRLESCVRDKYFRLGCDIVDADGESAAEVMLASGFALPYDGRAKMHDWCGAAGRAAPSHGCTLELREGSPDAASSPPPFDRRAPGGV